MKRLLVLFLLLPVAVWAGTSTVNLATPIDGYVPAWGSAKAVFEISDPVRVAAAHWEAPWTLVMTCSRGEQTQSVYNFTATIGGQQIQRQLVAGVTRLEVSGTVNVWGAADPETPVKIDVPCALERQYGVGAYGTAEIWVGNRPPHPVSFKETVKNDGPFREYYQFFARNAGGDLVPVGDVIPVAPYSSQELSFSADDLAGDVVLGKLSDVGEGVAGSSANWISLNGDPSATLPTPNPTPYPTATGTPVTAGGAVAKPKTGTSGANPLQFNQTGMSGTATDKGTAATVYGVGTVGNGLLQEIANNTKKSADAVDDTKGQTAPSPLEDGENPLQISADKVTGILGKIPAAPEIRMPSTVSSYTVPLHLPRGVSVSATVNLSQYAVPIQIFRTIVSGALVLWFFFMVVKAVKQAVAN